jgi:tetratricopeptide (TPR) repeat protein
MVKLNCGRALSFFWSLFFTVHPALTQAVAWIPGRNDILLGVFVLLSFMSFLSYLEGRKKAQLALHLLFLLLALLTKESAAALCALCAFFLFFMRGRQYGSGGAAPLWAGWAVIVSGWLLARTAVLQKVLGDAPFDIAGSLTANFPALPAYLGKIFFPVDLAILPVLKDLPLVYGLAAAVITAGLVLASGTRRMNHIVFGFVWFLLFLLPSFIQSAAAVAYFSEHRLYLPLIGFIFLLAELDLQGIFRLPGRRAAVLGGSVLCLFFATAFVHGGNFRDKISFWKKAVKSSPGSAFNCNNLGAMYYLDNDLPKAEYLFKKAVALNPGERRAHGNLGLIYMNTGRPGEAEEAYLAELGLDPRSDNVYLNLGLLYYNSGLADKAELTWEKALLINPDFEKVYTNLAVLNFRRKNFAKTRYYIQQMTDRGFITPPELLRSLAAVEKSR